PPGERYLRLVSHMHGPDLVAALRGGPAEALLTASSEAHHLFATNGAFGPVASAQWIDTMRGYLPGDILPKVDLSSMRHSLEVRAPLLDHVLADAVATLPAQLRMHRGRGKILLRRIAKRYLPDSIIERTKVGFSIPLADWLTGPLRPLVDHYLASNGPLASYIDLAKLPAERADRTANARRTYALLSLAVWASR
ncbi:MAG TPA: asparagine synthase-related protein, partial [Kofleriaceae bacterium]|nr:asparagine synthase-related protein [Kofleriaceae bacterium]